MNGLNFKDLIGKYKALPNKTKNLIFVVLGIAIFLAAYMLGFQKLQEATAEVQTEVDKQADYVAVLKDYHTNIDTYKKGIEDSKNSVNANLDRLPRGIKSEDLLMYVKIMNEDLGTNLNSVHIDQDSFIGEFPCVVEGKSVSVQAMRSGASFSSDANYGQVKDSLKYIYEQTKQITFLEGLALTYDSENALLTADYEISKYYITYDGSEYVPVPVPDVQLGVGDPFGTGS